MGIDKTKYTAKFAEEGLDNIRTVETLLFEVKDGGSVQDDIVTLMRSLHSLKGSARMLEFIDIETLSHLLESVFAALKEKTPVDLLRVHIKELTITGANNDEKLMDDAVKLLTDPELNLNSIVTHEIPFEKWEEAFNLVENAKDTCLKVSMIF